MRTLTHLRELLRLFSKDVFPESLNGYVLGMRDRKSSVDVAVRALPRWALVFLKDAPTPIEARVGSEPAQQSAVTSQPPRRRIRINRAFPIPMI